MINKRKILGCVCFLCVWILSACGMDSDIYLEEHEVETETLEVTKNLADSISDSENTNESGRCYVYICGAVLNPGVYVLEEGSRIYEAVELAGGLLSEADAASVNQAEPVVDGQMIQVFTQEEVQEAEREVESDGRIDINRADKNTLMTLPGIGEAKAEAILRYREENGAFLSVDELKSISGIKDGIFEQIKEHIKVSN